MDIQISEGSKLQVFATQQSPDGDFKLIRFREGIQGGCQIFVQDTSNGTTMKLFFTQSEITDLVSKLQGFKSDDQP